MATILSVIAPHDFQEIEYNDSKAALEAAGHKVVTACSEPVAVDKQGRKYRADVLLDEVHVDDYDAIAFIGGPGCFDYFDDATAHALAREFYKNNKVTAAICAAPSILARAGLLKGEKCTCFPSQTSDLKAHGAIVTGSDIETDGLIVTANGPSAAKTFGEAVAKLLLPD